MKRYGKWAAAAAVAMGLLFAAGRPADATPAYAKAAPAPVSVPAATAEAPAAGEDARMDKPMADSGTPCPCGREGCMKKCGKRQGHMHGEGEMPPMMEKMKGRIEELRKAVSDLRESGKKLEASAGSDPFRAAVLDHLKKLDDLQASHLEHMESMMGRMHGGKEATGSGKDGRHGCREKRGCDCPCGGMRQ